MPVPRYWTSGNVVEIDLGGTWSYAQVITSPLMGFYPARKKRPSDVAALKHEDFAFRIWVMKYAIGKNGWPIVGRFEVTKDEEAEPWFFTKDLVSGKLARYRDSTGEEISATVAECDALECAAAWDPKHVESRLADQFAGRPNKWVEAMRAK
jgi:hypothetical protein